MVSYLTNQTLTTNLKIYMEKYLFISLYYIYIYRHSKMIRKSLLLIKHVCVLILQRFKFFIEFLELISLNGLSYSSNNITISMTICVEIRIFSQFYLLYEMLHNLGV
jgi:hypothetical protein